MLLLVGCGASSGAPAPVSSAAADDPHAEGRLALLGTQPGEMTSGVIVVDLATGERSRVGGDQEAWSPAWTADPFRIALVRRAPGDAPGELVLAHADGSGTAVPIGETADVLEVTSSADGQDLAWIGRAETSSSDCAAPPPTQPLGLYVSAGDGSGARRVSDLAPTARGLAVSPDGRTTAVVDSGADTDRCSSGHSRLLLIDTLTGASSEVTGLPQSAGGPQWSPDGQTIVLSGVDFDATQTSDLVFVDVASATARRLVTDGAVETVPVFSPDGNRLAMLRRTQGLDTASITLAAADGTDQRTLVLTGTDDQDLAWSSDGSLLAVAGTIVDPVCEAGTEDSAPPGDCDVVGVAPDVRVVDVDGGPLRQVTDTTSLLEAGLAFAP